jgi:uncharacterized membrane protein
MTRKILLLVLLWTTALVRATIVTAGSVVLYVFCYYAVYGAEFNKSDDYILPIIGAIAIFVALILHDLSWIEKKRIEFNC